MRSVRALALVAAICALAVIAVAVSYLTATSSVIYQTRSGFACYQALPSCPPLPSSVSVFEPNWLNGIGVALLIGATAVVIGGFVRARLSHRLTTTR